MRPIQPGSRVVITDVGGDEYTVQALTPIQRGHKFPVVWVNVPLWAGGFRPMPWPADSVRLADDPTNPTAGQ